MMVQRAFARTIGIDYSGSDTPTTRLSGLAVYRADGNARPQKVYPPAGGVVRRWTRREIAEWLVAQLNQEDIPTLVGIDHAFSFPTRYFGRYNLPMPGWDHFLNDFRENWPTDGENALVSDIRTGTGRARCGETTWRRLTDLRSGTAKSVFHFNVQGSVAHSTHAGLPWLRHIRRELGARIHFWPFDGWNIPEGQSAIAEVYPALWSGRFARDDKNPHEHDAYSVAGWLSYADQNGYLPEYLNPALSQAERQIADTEGWILGVLGLIY